MVNVLLILGLAGTVIISVQRDKKREKEIEELKTGLENLSKNTYENSVDLARDIDKVREETNQNKKDIEAIADAINVYSQTIGGSVEQKVKANVDLFSEWLNGEEE